MMRRIIITEAFPETSERQSHTKGRQVAKEWSNLGGFVVYREIMALF
jgi:hypothetical protein